MKVIYEPSGKAKEYCDNAVNLYSGCPFGCTYCYVPSTMKKKADTFHSTAEVRKEILDRIKKDLEGNAYYQKEILLCFGCDPYQPLAATSRTTREAIKLIGEAKAIPVILTKGNTRQDFDLIKKANGKFGVTLTFWNPDHSKHWEPGAALPHERIRLLRDAKMYGLKTWVSFEPVIDPEQTLDLVYDIYKYADMIKIGKLNYHEHAKTIDWESFTHRMRDLLDELECRYEFKKDLQKYL